MLEYKTRTNKPLLSESLRLCSPGRGVLGSVTVPGPGIWSVTISPDRISHRDTDLLISILSLFLQPYSNHVRIKILSELCLRWWFLYLSKKLTSVVNTNKYSWTQKSWQTLSPTPSHWDDLQMWWPLSPGPAPCCWENLQLAADRRALTIEISLGAPIKIMWKSESWMRQLMADRSCYSLVTDNQQGRSDKYKRHSNWERNKTIFRNCKH